MNTINDYSTEQMIKEFRNNQWWVIEETENAEIKFTIDLNDCFLLGEKPTVLTVPLGDYITILDAIEHFVFAFDYEAFVMRYNITDVAGYENEKEMLKFEIETAIQTLLETELSIRYKITKQDELFANKEAILGYGSTPFWYSVNDSRHKIPDGEKLIVNYVLHPTIRFETDSNGKTYEKKENDGYSRLTIAIYNAQDGCWTYLDEDNQMTCLSYNPQVNYVQEENEVVVEEISHWMYLPYKAVEL